MDGNVDVFTHRNCVCQWSEWRKIAPPVILSFPCLRYQYPAHLEVVSWYLKRHTFQIIPETTTGCKSFPWNGKIRNEVQLYSAVTTYFKPLFFKCSLLFCPPACIPPMPAEGLHSWFWQDTVKPWSQKSKQAWRWLGHESEVRKTRDSFMGMWFNALTSPYLSLATDDQYYSQPALTRNLGATWHMTGDCVVRCSQQSWHNSIVY